MKTKIVKNGKLENVWSEGTYVPNLNQIKDQEFLNDLNKLFGDKLISVDDTNSPAKIAYSMNAFSSISEAKKNGLPSTLPKEVGFYDYYLSVPFGYSASKYAAKYKTSFTIYVPPIEKTSE